MKGCIIIPPGLAGRIATVRLRIGLSQTAFAVRIGVSRNMVVRYEHQGGHPRAETLARIAELGGVSSEWLLHGRRWRRRVGDEGPISRERS